MKKVFLIASLSLLAGLVLVGCSKKYTFDKYSEDISSLPKSTTPSWEQIRETLEAEEQAQILQKLISETEDCVKRLKDIEKKITDGDMKKAHSAVIKSSEIRVDAFKKILEGVNNLDIEIVGGGEEMLANSNTVLQDWLTYFTEKTTEQMSK